MVVVLRILAAPAAFFVGIVSMLVLMSLGNWKGLLYCFPQLKVAKSFGLGTVAK